MPKPHHPEEVYDALSQPVERAVVRRPVMAWPVLDVDRNYLSAMLMNQGRQEPVHVVERRQLKKELPGNDFQSATAVRGTIAQNPAAYTVGDA